MQCFLPAADRGSPPPPQSDQKQIETGQEDDGGDTGMHSPDLSGAKMPYYIL